MHAAISMASPNRAAAPKPALVRTAAVQPLRSSHAAAVPPRSVAAFLARRSSATPAATAEVAASGPSCDLEVDTVLAKELAENGERNDGSGRRKKNGAGGAQAISTGAAKVQPLTATFPCLPARGDGVLDI